MRALTDFLDSESGASAAEYALILAIIAAAIVGALVALQNSINTAISNAAGDIQNGTTSS